MCKNNYLSPAIITLFALLLIINTGCYIDEPTLPEYSLYISAGENGTTEPSGFVKIFKNKAFTIMALPNEGYELEYWSIEDGEGVDIEDTTAATTTVTLTSDGSVMAHFSEKVCVHEYEGEYEFDETHHWQVCILCGELSQAPHEIVQTFNETSHWDACSVCDYTANSAIHTLSGEYDEYEHWDACSGCGYISSSNPHTLSYNSDENYHWDECSVCDYQSGTSAHDFTSWFYNTIQHTRNCTICGHIQQDTHNSSGIDNNSTQHWNTCTICGFSHENRVNHTYGDWSSDGASTHSRRCTVCSHSQSENHILVPWSQTCASGYECTVCDYSIVTSHCK